uniref:AB hydrolase-1 domain-containing protein n=1 Tax=Bionectria ochroleuca TaxID=29856 RepID=A0A8H7MY50_BIOOC
MVIIMHGIAGGSHEVYLRHAVAPLVEAGWEACVINSRGCAKSELNSRFLYNGRATWDIRQLVKWLKGRFPNRPLYAVGFSLGGNMLTNFCGEEGENCLLSGAVVCSNPFNLEISNTLLSGQYLGTKYLNMVKDALVAYVKKHRSVLEEHLDIEAVSKVKSMEEFDRLVECAIWGYPTEAAYYRDASSSDSVLAIRIPFLAIHALDDPVALKEAVPWQEFKQNPNTVLLTTSKGGHISWYESGGGRWFPKAIAGFLNHLAFQADPESLGAVSYIKDDEDNKNIEYVGTRRKMLIEQY